ncbi:DUF2267 domain-containing protein [Aliihoeflea aestuarii]|jgi:uncharacterized protein (DUF2267 family)|uniref:DUF2267 domain-containing protein n=1 Tax=Aliihoeflea aestuarii TaxID=453840 RepID=UPI002092ED16|nr:DUF2267 domain-containing protein [Aliihoeflea aestuarii]
MPLEYARASEDFDRFVEALRQALGHDTRHQTYQTLESVLRVFRRRVTIGEGLFFCRRLAGGSAGRLRQGLERPREDARLWRYEKSQ